LITTSIVNANKQDYITWPDILNLINQRPCDFVKRLKYATNLDFDILSPILIVDFYHELASPRILWIDSERDLIMDIDINTEIHTDSPINRHKYYLLPQDAEIHVVIK